MIYKMNLRVRPEIKQKVLVTGGAGFIGSNFVQMLIQKQKYEVTVLDSLTYAGSLDNLSPVLSGIKFEQVDIRDPHRVNEIFKLGTFQIVVHFAAESHVDNSLLNPTIFIDTNIKGTQNLLNASIEHNVQKFLHISTDEVYGSIDHGSFLEESPFNPSSPYSASKAAAEHLVNAAHKTFGLVTNIVRCSNNYGPRQHPEKLIPLVILKAIQNHTIPIYGNGLNSREWINVKDCCEAILLVMENGAANSVYNISSEREQNNLDIVYQILSILEKPTDLIRFVEDRKGHDFRYAIDSGKIKSELGWEAKIGSAEGLAETIAWYRINFERGNHGKREFSNPN
jgi:dTDP-glucose 4,6-dehydratase